MSSHQKRKRMKIEHEVLDPEIFPFEKLWETNDLFLECFETDYDGLPQKKKIKNRYEFYRRINEIEMTYKAIRAILYNKDLCEFLKDMVGFDKTDFANVSI